MAKPSTSGAPKEKVFNFPGNLTIEMIRTLIRYDIPILILGKSSIGKSYTIIELSKIYRIPSQVLYVGSEKPEHIEGLPKLVGSAGSEILDYYKPYWFPYAEIISGYVRDGREMFEVIKSSYVGDFRYTYNILSKLLKALSEFEWGANQITAEIVLQDKDVKIGSAPIDLTEKIKFTRQISKDKNAKDDIRNACIYLSTLLGYGNFWLVLDELDKVEERDIDKYAPLLHIVRERWLKSWRLRDINEGKGIDVTRTVKNSDYSEVKKLIDGDIEAKRSLLDTRIVGIANKTKNIEDALFRRFVQIIMEDVMVLKTPPKDMTIIQQCVEKEVQPIEGDALTEGLRVQRIKDVNLQWTYNFFVKMTNKNDMEGNFIRRNYLDAISNITIDPTVDQEAFDREKLEDGKISAIYKILRDNFEGADLVVSLFQCISSQMDVRKAPVQATEIEMIRNHIVEMAEKDYGPADMKGEILENLSSSYPTTEKDKLGELKRWVGRALMYVDATLLDVNGKLSQMPVNALLIPAIQKLIYEKLSLDSSLNEDNVKSMFADIDSFWSRIITSVPANKIQVDAGETQRAIYGATIEELKKIKDGEKINVSENSIMGAGNYIRGEKESTDAYKNSLSYKYMMKQSSGIFILIGNLARSKSLNTLKNYPDLTKFIEENHRDNMKKYVERVSNSPKAGALEVAKSIEQFLKL